MISAPLKELTINFDSINFEVKGNTATIRYSLKGVVQYTEVRENFIDNIERSGLEGKFKLTLTPC